VNNNGSAFGGLTASGPFYCLMLAAGMFVGRYWVIVPTLALAGSLAAGRKSAAGEGTLPTHGATFVLVLTAIVLVVGALTFFPALTLGPFAEALR
jgi:K+-transporting ATPase ATPase A chain